MTTHQTPWHVADGDLVGYAAGTTSAVVSTSVEAHLMACETCRERLADTTAADEVELAWRSLADVVDRPSPGFLGRLGRGHRLARSAVATPTMAMAALAAIALVVLVPLVAASAAGEAALLALLVAAPLAPVAAAGVAYREWADPAGEISLATASAGLRLVAMRALVVACGALAVSIVALLLVGVWVELPVTLLFSWCLPGLALSALVMLAGTTRFDPVQVAGGLSAAWAAVVVTSSLAGRRLRPEAVLDVVASPAIQVVALSIALTALSLTVARRDAVSYRRTA